MATLNIKKFPDELYEALQKLAAIDRRSLAQEVIALLQSSVEESLKPSILELKGLGKKTWAGTKASKHINDERDSWD